ncbi:MAG TPA: HDOD domain-containing protein, partial [Telluria sp.]|nr:HDOD domain-containing protein [Telluria sp.]
MKNWIKGLFSGSEGAPSATVAEAAAQAADIGPEVDATYYRWLTAMFGYRAPAEVEERLLEEVRKITLAPSEAEGLVPRVPEVIPQLLRSLRDDGVSANQLSRQVQQDVVLTAEVIREANSAYYNPISPAETIEAAIMMLGQNGLRMLLARLAFRPLIKMQSEGFARAAAANLWSHSEKCALASSIVASNKGAGVFESYLAGLMQDVGLIVAFRLAAQVCPDNKIPGSSEFGAKLLDASRELSASIATHWDFPDAVVDAISQAGDPGESRVAQALALGDRIAKLSQLLDKGVLQEDDPFITQGLDAFQRR